MISNLLLGTAGLLLLLGGLLIITPIAIALLGAVVSHPLTAVGLIALIVAIGKFVKQV